ncbi:hypothetical protein C4K10_2733 [Pseudomonas chlororaphis subsp. aureofaciens]|nr:hypothetical protein C4K10_2733 [Pseudomonas chlororaphis subsp. aureofaciens]
MTGRLPRGSWPMLAKRFSRQIGLAPWPAGSVYGMTRRMRDL